ncbi:MAG: group 1 truncated hemoglobin [Magnetovibrio sp.]|nr:group 1 truncated hemoglobin [Magnetovibrio sp.]
MSSESAYFVKLGGRQTIERVHEIFYGKMYAHPWLKQFFVASPRKHQESQQSDFIISILGGGPVYSGRIPKHAHTHLFITDEIFDIRHGLLAEALHDAGVSDELAEPWLRRDEKFRTMLVKQSIGECEGRYRTEEIIAPHKPAIM